MNLKPPVAGDHVFQVDFDKRTRTGCNITPRVVSMVKTYGDGSSAVWLEGQGSSATSWGTFVFPTFKDAQKGVLRIAKNMVTNQIAVVDAQEADCARHRLTLAQYRLRVEAALEEVA